MSRPVFRCSGQRRACVAGAYLRGAAWAIGLACVAMSGAARAQPAGRAQAMEAAIHPVTTIAAMQRWLARTPRTRLFPADFSDTMRGHGPAFVVEMSTAPACLPCADLWAKLNGVRVRYGWQIRTIDRNEALLRSGRLGLPWVGHPVAWVRPIDDPLRTIPVAIGTDHAGNIARNLYLAAKMLTGVRPAVGVRGMAKFTGIVGASGTAAPLPGARR